MVAGTFTVQAPTVPAPVKGGLLAHVDPVLTPGARLMAGVQYETPVACGRPSAVPDWCVDASAREEKEISPQDLWRQGDTFSAYLRLQCGPFGNDGLASRAAAALDRAIGLAAEEAFVTALAADEDTQVAAAAPLATALGLAEEQAVLMPGGHIWIARSAIPAFGSQVRHSGDDGVLFTRQGTPIINYYTPTVPSIGGTSLDAGQAWVIVTGQPHLWLGETLTFEAEDLPQNDWDALAERVGAVAWDCGAWAIPAEVA